MIWGLLALITAAMFFGAAIYINLAEHPARLELPVDAAVKQWHPSYKRGYAMQASLALIGTVFGGLAWWSSDDLLWLAGAVIFLANWPFTLLAIMPVNRQLESIDAGRSANEARQLLVRWGRLHAVRSALGGLSTLIYLVSLLQMSSVSRP